MGESFSIGSNSSFFDEDITHRLFCSRSVKNERNSPKIAELAAVTIRKHSAFRHFDIPPFKNILKPIHMVFGQKKRVLI
ncbi:MAG: hypothetical protein ACLS3F_11355 [Oscillospiraceae bacterium]